MHAQIQSQIKLINLQDKTSHTQSLKLIYAFKIPIVSLLHSKVINYQIKIPTSKFIFYCAGIYQNMHFTDKNVAKSEKRLKEIE